MAGTGKSESAVLIHTWNVDKHSLASSLHIRKLFNQIKEVPCFNCEYPLTMTRMRWAFVIIHTVKDQH